MLILFGAGLILLIVISVLAWTSTSRARAADEALEDVRQSLSIPQDWTVVTDEARTSGFLGLCFSTAMDVRACPSQTLAYSLEEVPSSVSALQEVLPGADWASGETDCAAVPANVSGRFGTCTAATSAQGFRIEVSAEVEASQGGSVKDPRVIITIVPE